MPLDMRYLDFCQDGHPFYARPSVPEDALYQVATPPAQWTKTQDGPWVSWRNPSVGIPEQGWKIHISSTEEHAARVLEAVSTFCFENDLTFKHLVSPTALRDRNWKYADRSASGKFVTIYTRTEHDFEHALRGIDGSSQSRV